MIRILLLVLLFSHVAPLLAEEHQPRTAIVYDDLFKLHLAGTAHPEKPERCTAIVEALREDRFDGRIAWFKPRAATEEEVLLCHTPEYLEIVKRDIAAGRRLLSTGDTNIGAESLNVALHAVGAVLVAVDKVMAGEVQNAFCPVRPPGHHAESAIGMGFCIFNNVAVAARYAQTRHGLERVMIVDWDVHHGNGTQEIFYSDPSVFFISMHQWPLYPGTGSAEEKGEGEGIGYTVNIPLARGTEGRAAVEAFRKAVTDAAETFKPQLVLISAGFDAHKDDPLGGLRLDDADFAAMTRIVMDAARDHADGRVVSVLEGGYNLQALARAAAAHVWELSQREAAHEGNAP